MNIAGYVFGAAILMLLTAHEGVAQNGVERIFSDDRSSSSSDGGSPTVATRQTLLEDVVRGATWGAIAGLVVGSALAIESVATEPESMGLLLVIAVPAVAIPAGALVGAVVHAAGGDLPGWTPLE